MTLLLQISDPHFGTERAAVVEALLRFADAMAPDLVVMSGDLTQRAPRPVPRAARAFVDRLGATPTLVIPGNHDIPLFNPFARLVDPYANHRRAFGPDLEPVFDSPELLVIGINTTRPYRHKDGEVSMQQVKRVAERLERASPAQLRVVVAHQPVAVTRAQDEANLLHGHARAVQRWARAGADLIAGGHIHLPYVLLPHSVRQPAAPHVGVQAGTALSTRLRGEINNSVNLIRYEAGMPGPRRAVVERWDYSETSAAFGRVTHHELVFEAAQPVCATP